MTPERSYLICATPRSGSTLLCAALGDTNIAGKPAEHFEMLIETGRPRQPRDYFQRSNNLEVWALLDDPEFEAILGGPGGWYAEQPAAEEAPLPPPDFEALRQHAFEIGTTPNGVFGTKIMWAYFRDFVRLARRDGRHAVPPCEVASEVLPHLSRYIWIWRNDTAKQAVSLWKALQTWSWRQDDDADYTKPELRYNYAAIAHLKLRIDEHNLAWQNFFVTCGIEPVKVAYEDFVKDYEGTLLGLLSAVGVETPTDFAIKQPTMRRQADKLSDAWVSRFKSEQRARSPFV